MQSEQMTQREFAQALGISPSSLSSIFNGHTSPTNNTVQAIHRHFPEISITWLMFGEGEMLVNSDLPAGKSDEQKATAADGIAHSDNLHESEPVMVSGADGFTAKAGYSDPAGQQQVIIRETVKYIDKPQRRITEIHVFYDDGTFETFSGKRE